MRKPSSLPDGVAPDPDKLIRQLAARYAANKKGKTPGEMRFPKQIRPGNGSTSKPVKFPKPDGRDRGGIDWTLPKNSKPVAPSNVTLKGH